MHDLNCDVTDICEENEESSDDEREPVALELPVAPETAVTVLDEQDCNGSKYTAAVSYLLSCSQRIT